VKQDALSPLLFDFASEYAIRANKTDRLELYETHQLLACANAIDSLGENIKYHKETHRSSARC
jgi:hypothetical protein